LNTDSDRWINILQNLEPSYFKWKDIMDNGPSIIPKLSQKGRKWEIILEEQFVVDSQYYETDFHDNLGQAVEWATEQLKTWPKVRRLAYDQWEFLKKNDAEKFITLFHLSCPQ
jgi:hypothetical protein